MRATVLLAAGLLLTAEISAAQVANPVRRAPMLPILVGQTVDEWPDSPLPDSQPPRPLTSARRRLLTGGLDGTFFGDLTIPRPANNGASWLELLAPTEVIAYAFDERFPARATFAAGTSTGLRLVGHCSGASFEPCRTW